MEVPPEDRLTCGGRLTLTRAQDVILGEGADYPPGVPESRRGLLLGAGAYVLWGLFPLYWQLLEPAGAVEILAQRILWSALVMVVVVALWRRADRVRAILSDRRTTLLLTLAAVTISANWVTYIWGVNNGRVVETSLGYYINPLVTVLMGVVVLGERLRAMQWAAMGLAGVAVLVLTVDYGRPPWVALILACSFGTYGLAKKQAGVEAAESLTSETLLIAPFALAWIAWLAASGGSTFGTDGVGRALLFTTTGIITAVPLLLFGAAAIRVSMVTL
jgi:chloramphenicol-sensitive protein RarD